jgi:hypothetical protein
MLNNNTVKTKPDLPQPPELLSAGSNKGSNAARVLNRAILRLKPLIKLLVHA